MIAWLQATRKTWPAWIVLGAGMLASILASHLVRQDIEKMAVRQFALSCDQITLQIQERLGAYALILRGAAGLFAASGTVTRGAWQAYVEKLRAEVSIPGVQGIGFAQVIPPGRLEAHIGRIRGEGFPQYSVRPAGERAVTTSIIYLEPFRDRNLRAFGFDMYSEPIRRAAMEQARASGEAALSGKVELVQETRTDVQAGTLMYVPVYRNGASVDSPERRQAALIGWTYSPYLMSDLMLGMLGDRVGEMRNAIDLHIYDGADATPAALLFDSRFEQAFEQHSLFHQQRRIGFNGHQWLLAFDQTQAASGISYMPAWSTLLGGIALSGLLFWLMLSVINTRVNAMRIAAELTAEVRERVAQLNTIFELSPDGFVSFDRNRRVVYASPAIARLTGLQGPQIAGLDEAEFSARLALVCTNEARFPGVAAVRGAQTSGVSARGNQNEQRQRIEIGGASRRVLECAIRLSETATVSQILYFRDVTHETEVDQMKSEFLSTAAHELRTPMTTIYGFAELMLERDFGEADRREFLGTIVRQSKLTVSILNELLDLVRIEERRGKDFTIERVDLCELLREIAAGFGTPEGRTAPALPAPDGPLWVRADRGKLTQAVSNVLSNAYKYSRPGSGVEIEPAESAGGACVRITDHGIGMTPEQLARVGERFYRADTSGKIPGTGLGMTIVREIIQLHGGSATLASEAGVGTTVTLWIPAA